MSTRAKEGPVNGGRRYDPRLGDEDDSLPTPLHVRIPDDIAHPSEGSEKQRKPPARPRPDTSPKISITTSSIQYENDDLMRVYHGDDYAIACCVSSMRIGKEMQFFGARANLAKCLLYAINGGRDEVTGKQVTEPGLHTPITGEGPLDFDEVWQRYEEMLDWVVGTYVEALNIIHYMHDKYAYERLEMALHDGDILRTMACGIAGLSVVTDSLSAIKHAQAVPTFDDRGIAVEFTTTGNQELVR